MPLDDSTPQLLSPGFTPRPSLSDDQRHALPPGGRLSPGFTPRPSLSERAVRRFACRPAAVAGVHPPAFVERPSSTSKWAGATASVAGVHPPAFVERPDSDFGSRGPRLSPGFTPRPSLSETPSLRVAAHRVLSPGFTPRPSLSDLRSHALISTLLLSPGFTPRPSLSAPSPDVARARLVNLSPGFTPPVNGNRNVPLAATQTCTLQARQQRPGPRLRSSAQPRQTTVLAQTDVRRKCLQ